jgi:hypothetical protein
MNEQTPKPYRVATGATVQCVATAARLLAGRRLRHPPDYVGRPLRFADGTTAPVYRETVVVDRWPSDPCVLVVSFRLRVVRGWGHTLFRAESWLNIPLFVGYPGFVSKLWLAHDGHDVYRGIYQWDGPEQAGHYARCLWRVLALVSAPGSIRYRVLPNLRRDDVLDDPHLLDDIAPDEAAAWWRLVATAQSAQSPAPANGQARSDGRGMGSA